MKEHPIIFSGAMIRAILEGRKTQTRRVIKPQPINLEPDWWVWKGQGMGRDSLNPTLFNSCPYGKPGDLLVLKSQWATEKQYDNRPPSKLPPKAQIWTLWDGDLKPEWCGRTRSARFIPKRLYPHFPKAEITDVRVERVQEISEEDARAEGIIDGGCLNCGEHEPCGCNDPQPDARDAFIYLWNSINEKRGYGWIMNPWVWVLSFGKVS